MKYVIYHNMFTMSMQDGFIVRETDTDYHLVLPLVYEWLERRGELERVHDMQTFPLDKSMFRLVENNYPLNHYDEWVFDFPMEHRTNEEFYEICRYFEFQQHGKKKEPIQMLEQAVEPLKPVLNRETVGALIDFTLMQLEIPEFRLKTTLSPVINRALFQKRRE